MSGKRDVPGNAMASAIAVQRHLLGLGEKLIEFEHITDRLFEDGIEIKSVRVRCPQGEHGTYLVVAQAVGQGGKLVSFHDGSTLAEALIGFISRLQNKSVRWKDDG